MILVGRFLHNFDARLTLTRTHQKPKGKEKYLFKKLNIDSDWAQNVCLFTHVKREFIRAKNRSSATYADARSANRAISLATSSPTPPSNHTRVINAASRSIGFPTYTLTSRFTRMVNRMFALCAGAGFIKKSILKFTLFHIQVIQIYLTISSIYR